MTIFNKFHKDRTKIVDFLLIVKLLAYVFFHVHPLRDAGCPIIQSLIFTYTNLQNKQYKNDRLVSPTKQIQ